MSWNCSEDPSCAEWRAHIFELVDAEWCPGLAEDDTGDTDRQVLALFRAHVETCPSCRDAMDAERHVRELLQRCCGVRAPESLRLTILSLTTSSSAG